MNRFVKKFTVGPLKTCMYLVEGKFIIDPAGFNAEIKRELENTGGGPEAILLTHAHADHFAGLKELLEIYPGCPVFCHNRAREILADPARNLSGWLGEEYSYDGARPVSNGKLPGIKTGPEVIYTPGHSPGSISFYWPEENSLFSGDVVFAGGVGRTDLPGGDMRTLKETISEKLFELPGPTRIYPGHGPETTVEKEKKHNPCRRGSI